ncbi:Disease resistance protein RGA2 [Glycine max]|nr:Disease resistance protein RGA2 [Glycine max]
MAEAVVEIVLEKLNSLIQKELGLFFGFDEDMKRIASLLTTIKATLEDAEEKKFSNIGIKYWLGKLKDAARILDDILDECGPSNKVQSSYLSSFLPKHVVFHYKIVKKMKRVREMLEEISDERNKFNLTEMVLERSRVIEWRKTTSSITDRQIYGREEDKDKIVNFLVDDAPQSEDLSVYPIVGLGGLGKTTLAQLVFNHKKVVSHFELRFWVCVSEDFSLRRMIKAIIKAASGHACEDLDLEPQQRRLQDLLQRKRYLLVLDDVWDDKQENWQKLKSLLACGAKGASILVTTRLSKVAEIMGTIKIPHELSLLSDNDCWELFKHQAFGPNEVELENMGKEIVKKCRGLPLAAKALGSLLHSARKKHEWFMNVKGRNLLELSLEDNSIMASLRLSYFKLPIRLRQCFAYCAIFPKDERIWKQQLIELWMANGFILSNERLDAEDVGEDLWNELYWRSFFQDIEKDEFGKVTSFKLHNLVHDLARSVTEDVCCVTEGNDGSTWTERIHHLSDHRLRPDSIQLHQVKYLRTYLLPHQRGGALSPDVLKCYSLRMLHLGQMEELPSSIGDLKHLRYLNLSGGEFETLPESLCKLWNLQILKLDHCRSLQMLPNSLIILKYLQQLSLKDCYKLSSLPPQIAKLTSLRSLTKYFVGKERGFLLVELGALKLKGDLEIKHLGKVKSVKDASDANMSSKQLNKLTLSWDRYDEEWELQENVEEILEVLHPDTQQLQSLWVGGYKGAYFPQWIFSPSLMYLRIERCREINSLHEALQHMTVLHSLSLYYLRNLESLPECLGNLPLLHELAIGFCSKLRSLPMSLSLGSLKMLRIWGCPELEKQCGKETGEALSKIAQFPEIRVNGYLIKG